MSKRQTIASLRTELLEVVKKQAAAIEALENRIAELEAGERPTHRPEQAVDPKRPRGKSVPAAYDRAGKPHHPKGLGADVARELRAAGYAKAYVVWHEGHRWSVRGVEPQPIEVEGAKQLLSLVDGWSGKAEEPATASSDPSDDIPF